TKRKDNKYHAYNLGLEHTSEMGPPEVREHSREVRLALTNGHRQTSRSGLPPLGEAVRPHSITPQVGDHVGQTHRINDQSGQHHLMLLRMQGCKMLPRA